MAPPHVKPGPLGRVAGFSFRYRGTIALAWLIAIGIAIGLSATLSGEFTADYSAPGSDSEKAQDLIADRFPAESGDRITVVIRAEDGVENPAVQTEVRDLLAQLGENPHVTSVQDPFTPRGLAPDGQTLRADLVLDVLNPVDLPIDQTEQLLAVAAAAERPGLEVALGGFAVDLAEQGEIGSEAIALVAAALILLVTFGSVVAAGLPMAVAAAGLVISATLTGGLAAAIDVPDWTTALATMLGIALGIDYTLLMVTRFREWRAVGLDPQAATVATLDTAGRSVMVAGSTVVVSMLGLFAMGLSFMRGAATVTIMAVLVVMAAAVTLFPALLGYLGAHIDRLRLPLGRRRPLPIEAGGHVQAGRGWLGWGTLVDRHSIIATVLGVAILLALASPFLGTRFGFPDAGNNAEGTSSRTAYDMITDGFGPGANGRLVLAVDLADAEPGAAEQLANAAQLTDGVAAVLPPLLNPAGDAALISVFPETGPQHADTAGLVGTLRDDVVPAASAGTGAVAHVGGVSAVELDSNTNTAERLPYLIGGVVGLSMLLLLVSFRSVVIPITAAVMNLLSVAAAYGVMALALDGGWFGQLFGIDTSTPMPAFIPVLVFAVLFGLSMDYEVFLISRMRESWVRGGENSRAIVDGMAGTGRVITAAAAIMIVVFAAFVPSDDVFIKVIGIGMAAAILVDATVVRMLLVPAAMHWMGRANWWLPKAWDRRLPQLYVEGRPDMFLPERDREPALSA